MCPQSFGIRLDPEKSSHSQNWILKSNHQNWVNNPTLFQRKLIRIEKNKQITKTGDHLTEIQLIKIFIIS
jgi:hypothetical protein